MSLARIHPAFFILIACVLWASDIFVRYSITLKVDSFHIIFWENLIGLAVFSFLGIKKYGRQLFKMSQKEYWLVAFLGVFGSALAGYFFSMSIKMATPSTFSFLQVFQPLLVVWLAGIFLKEKTDSLFVMWASWIILSALMMNSHEIKLGAITKDITENTLAVLMGVGAMLIWGACTVVGKKLLESQEPLKIMLWRWIFATATTGVVFLATPEPFDYTLLANTDALFRLFYIGAIAGCLGMWFYYMGLSRLKAGTTAFIELAYPALGLLFSGLFIYGEITFLQLIGAFSMAGGIFILTINSKEEDSRAFPASH